MSSAANNFYSNLRDPQLEKNLLNDLNTKGLKFTYAKRSLEQFSQQYVSDGWLGRKLQAIPSALWSLLVTTTYDIARVIFIGIPKTFSKAETYNLKTYGFYFSRDMEEVAGKIITIFNDRLGTYLVHEARFQKSCYAIHEALQRSKELIEEKKLIIQRLKEIDNKIGLADQQINQRKQQQA